MIPRIELGLEIAFEGCLKGTRSPPTVYVTLPELPCHSESPVYLINISKIIDKGTTAVCRGNPGLLGCSALIGDQPAPWCGLQGGVRM